MPILTPRRYRGVVYLADRTLFPPSVPARLNHARVVIGRLRYDDETAVACSRAIHPPAPDAASLLADIPCRLTWSHRGPMAANGLVIADQFRAKCAI